MFHLEGGEAELKTEELLRYSKVSADLSIFFNIANDGLLGGDLLFFEQIQYFIYICCCGIDFLPTFTRGNPLPSKFFL